MLKSKHAPIKQSGTRASNQFKIVVVGLPNSGTTHLINQLLNAQFSQQTKGFKVYHCSVNPKTFKWKEEDISYQPSAKNKSCIRAVIFEVIVTKTILDLLHLLIAPEDIILLAYDPSLLSTASYMADIDYILNFVSAHCSANCCSSALHCPHFPLVLMVGIYNFSTMNSHTIDFLCHGKTYEKHILQLEENPFYLNAEYRSMVPEYKIHFLKENIIAAAKQICNQHCPSMYLHFEKTILTLSKSRLLLSTVQATDIAYQAGIDTTEQLFEHFRNKGIIFYYPKVQALQNKIFISPQKLITYITYVFEKPEYSSFEEEITQLRTVTKKHIVYLLKTFDLAVAGHWSISKTCKAGFHYDSTPFIIPSLVNTKIVSKRLKPKDYVGVFYYFPDEFLPKCVFYQLMTKLINWFHSDENTINW